VAFRLRGRVGRLWSWAAFLEDEPWPLVLCVALGVALCLPAVGSYRVLDDAILERAVRGPTLPGLADGIFGMFSFASGDPLQNRELMDRGVLLPWWSDPELRVAFFRPLSALTHAFDFIFWPSASELMYLHSLAWLALVIAAAAVLYRQLEPSRGAAVAATLLFAVDPAHGSAVAWLSSRNTLIAAFFGLCAVSAWVARSRRLATLLLLAALLAGEAGVGALGYIVCHVWLLEQRPRRERIFSLVPILVVTIVWRALHVAFGFGARGSGAYIDPVHDLGAWAAVLPERFAASLGAVLGPIPADLMFVGKAEHVPIFLALALGTALAFTLLIGGRIRVDARARFWACGALVAALPLSAGPPNDRGLLLVALGAKALVARLVLGLGATARTEHRSTFGRALTIAFVAWHAIGAPLVCLLRSAQFQAFGRRVSGAHRVLDTVPDLSARTVVVLNPPLDLLASYVQPERAVRGAQVARHFYWLASASSTLRITRATPEVLEVTRDGGLCSTTLERLYRRDPRSLSRDTSLRLGAVRVDIVKSTRDGLPETAQFRFQAPLEDDSFVFLAWKGGEYERVPPPALGRTVTFQPEDPWLELRPHANRP
jgi:hypothetical protein